MVRTPNPLVERMTFFWHRHWANSRASVSPTQLLMNQNTLLRKYGDLAANPDVSFRDMALEVSKDPSMLRYLNGESNVKGGPNENYGREFMELFTLGVNHVITGAKNYTENDVAQLAKSFTGWYIDDKDPDNAKALFDSSRWFNGPKSVFGKLGNYNTDSVVDLVLSQDGHAPYIVNKLWGEFMPTPPPTATLQKLSSRLRRERPQDQAAAARDPHRSAAVRVDRRAEHDQAAGRLRQPARCARSASASPPRRPADYLDSMGQVPYFPPTVAGWEGGLSWLNTNTALARFGFIGGRHRQRAERLPGEGRRRPQRDASGGLRPRLRRGGSALDVGRHACGDPGLRRARLGQEQQGPHRPPGHAAHAHARGPRRTGDVT